ncbi:hypothetical protein [Pseudonocardia alni]|uniref:hypothetical protein n=1 Tax=Pseudonocardia alni TaxID=33907 RepID=UPI00280C35E6|nr:hypothetical protein [Pseudonocardia alni]
MDKLTRDVFVNIVANLITAAILYLAAVTLGALPQNSNLQLTAATSAVGLFGGLAFASWMRNLGKQRTALVSLFIPCGAYIVFAGAVFPADGRPWWLALPTGVAGGLVVLLGMWVGLRYDERGRHAQPRRLPLWSRPPREATE